MSILDLDFERPLTIWLAMLFLWLVINSFSNYNGEDDDAGTKHDPEHFDK